MKTKFFTTILLYLSTLISLVTQFYITSFFNKNDFVQFNIGKSIFQMYDLTDLGGRQALEKLLPQSSNYKSVFYIVSLNFIVTLLSILLFVFWIILGYTNYIYLSLSLSGIFYALVNSLKSYYRSKGDLISFSKLLLLNDVLLPIIPFLLLVFYKSFFFYCSTILLSYITLYLIVYSKTLIKIIFFFPKIFKYVAEVLRNSYLLFLNTLFLMLSSTVDRIVISEYFHDFAADFIFIFTLFSLVNIIPTSLIQVHIKDLILNTNKEYYNKFIQKILFLSIISNLFIYVLYSYIITFFPLYVQNLNLLQITLVGNVLYSIYAVLFYYFHSVDKRLIILKNTIYSTVLYYIMLLIMYYSNVTNINFLVFIKLSYYLMVILLLIMSFLKYEKKDSIIIK